MTGTLADILGWGQESLMIGFIVFLRVGAAMALLPAFGERTIPVRVRLALSIVFTLTVIPPVYQPVLAVSGRAPDLIRFMLTETVIGLSVGLSVRLFIMTLQVAGSMAAQSTSLSQLFGGGVSDPQPAIGHLFVVSGLAIAVSAGLHVQIARLFIYSYQVLPPGVFPNPAVLTEWGIEKIATSFALAFTLAAPFVVASLIYNVALGVINRAMPQLMVSFVGAPAISAGGLFLLFVSTPIILTVWKGALTAFFDAPFE